MKKLSVFFILVLMSTTSLFAADKGIVVDVSLSPAGSFQIKSAKVKGKMVKSGDGKIRSNGLKVSVRSLKTGIDMRDDHLKKRLMHKKFKKVEIVKAIGAKGRGVGIILVKGIKKKFKFSYKEMGNMIKAKFKLSLKDFKIKDLSYMGVGVEDKVTVIATVPLK